ncbi:MAG TPA: HAMP domain-containing sensor histidine kinase, partial [Mucilaginibacter sp.]|nr:HAMP domain-containing sensor histidine kinase [Mucilaginibacter sp.]
EFLTLISRLGTSVKSLDSVIRDLNLILDVKQQVHEQTEEVSFTQITEDIKMTFDTYEQQGLIEIKCDFKAVDTMHSLKNYIHSIFYNLISNSIKFRRPEEKLLLQITSYQKKDKISIHFRDNGKGIDLETNGDKLFGLYRRFDTSVDGKGMGLYMVKTQVETLGGQVKVQSKPGAGATFIVEFPENS